MIRIGTSVAISVGSRLGSSSIPETSQTLIYAVGVNNDDTGGGIYVYDESFNYLDEFHDLVSIYNGTSYGEIFPTTSISNPRGIAIDDQGRFYVIDIGYGTRIYRINPDFTLDETFLFEGNPYHGISESDFPDSIDVDSDYVMYVGNRSNEVYVYQPNGDYSVKSLGSILENNLIGGLVHYNSKFYLTDKDVIYEFDSDFNYTGSSWNSTFVEGGIVHGTNLYGLTRIENGFAAVDIEEDELIIYDNDFQPISYVNHELTVTSIRGLFRTPIISTGEAPLGLPEFENRGFLIDFAKTGTESPNPWNNITAVDQAATTLIDDSGNSTGISLAITSPFKSIDATGGHSLGGIPYSAMEDSFVLRGYESTNSVIELSGLNNEKTYTIKLYASNSDENSVTDFWINGVKKSIDAHDNYTEIAVYENIIPDAENKIKVEVNSDDNYSYLNAMTAEEI